MAIRGSLNEAPLPDVLQLLAMGRKTGCLSLTHRGNLASIYFDAGRITHASIVNRRDRIGDRLVRSGVITQDVVEAAIASQRERPDSRLGDLLVETGQVPRHVLVDQLRIQVEETVYLLYTWTDGTFNFDGSARLERHSALVSINPESLMLEGARRVDEWSLIEDEVPSFDLVFALEDPSRVALADAPERLRIVLAQVDGARNVTQLAEECALSELDVGKVLHEALAAGLVRRCESAPTAVADSSGRVEEHRNLGVAFYRAGMLDEALREFRRVLELVRDDRQASAYCGLVLLKQQQWHDAATVYLARSRAAEAKASDFHNLALALERQGKYADAAAALDEGVSREPGDARLLTSLGAVRLLLADAAGAQAAFERARAATAQPSAAWFHYAALAAAWTGDRARAIDLLAEGAMLHPNSAVLRNNRAVLLERDGRAQEALDDAMRGTELDHSLAHLHKNIGDLYYRAARYDEAFAAYMRATAAEPSLGADVYLRLGNIHMRRREAAQADSCWERSLALDPTNAIARGNLTAIRRGAPGAAS
jgi:tetratricopeptide (TPR) repeat protein